MPDPNQFAIEFRAMDAHQLASYTSVRGGETKLGERVQTRIDESTRFVVLGICEDIGPRANGGNGGAMNAFDAFLSKFLNMQSNHFLTGENIAILGAFHVECASNDVQTLRENVAELDQNVIEKLAGIDWNDKRLIVIGGGHNNAYPIIKGLFVHHPHLHILNIDPHADCRPLEGRHSGNPFSTAITEKLVGSYTVLGLHQQYNSAATYQFLDEHNCTYTFFEDHLDGQPLSSHISDFLSQKQGAMGLEIDLDSIEYMPSSASTPSGFTLNEIRSVVRQIASQHQDLAYFHLPEGASHSNEEKTVVGKALAYLVSDFIKNFTD
jgi:formiminoglutamase